MVFFALPNHEVYRLGKNSIYNKAYEEYLVDIAVALGANPVVAKLDMCDVVKFLGLKELGNLLSHCLELFALLRRGQSFRCAAIIIILLLSLLCLLLLLLLLLLSSSSSSSSSSASRYWCNCFYCSRCSSVMMHGKPSFTCLMVLDVLGLCHYFFFFFFSYHHSAGKLPLALRLLETTHVAENLFDL